MSEPIRQVYAHLLSSKTGMSWKKNKRNISIGFAIIGIICLFGYLLYRDYVDGYEEVFKPNMNSGPSVRAYGTYKLWHNPPVSEFHVGDTVEWHAEFECTDTSQGSSQIVLESSLVPPSWVSDTNALDVPEHSVISYWKTVPAAHEIYIENLRVGDTFHIVFKWVWLHPIQSDAYSAAGICIFVRPNGSEEEYPSHRVNVRVLP